LILHLASTKRAQFADVAFAITAAASAEAASAAAAELQAWSDLDRLDQDCSATMKVYYLKDNPLQWYAL